MITEDAAIIPIRISEEYIGKGDNMSVTLTQEVIDVINGKETQKVLATVDKDGRVNVAFKGSLHYEDGLLVVNELLETSQTNKNLTYSLWFDKEVAAVFHGPGATEYQIKGIPRRVLIEGPVYEKAYVAALERNLENDLAGVWYIEPTEFRDLTLPVRLAEQKAKYPILGHLDKDVNPDYYK